MTDEEIIELINNSLSEEFELKIEEMVPEASLFDELGLDSLDTVDMVVVLEKAFKFKIREDEGIQKIRTLGDIHDFVIKKKNEMGKKA